jgi:hypothetical protein
MRRLTFKRYQVNEGETFPAIRWTFLPVDLDEAATVTAAEFDPTQKARFGLLLATWRGHPEFALVVTGIGALAVGEHLAVSDEKGTP